MIKYKIGEKKINANNNFIILPEPLKQIEFFNNIFVVLFYKGNRDISLEPKNNISVYNFIGKQEWGIEELINKSKKCKKWRINKTFFFSMEKDDNILCAHDMMYHFYIDINKKKIIEINIHK